MQEENEISIMKYVGATNGFIRWPFVVEGIIIGVISALISILLLGLAYNGTTNASIKLITINIITIRNYFILRHVWISFNSLLMPWNRNWCYRKYNFYEKILRSIVNYEIRNLLKIIKKQNII